MSTIFKKGCLVKIKPEWMDKGDENLNWITLDDEQNGKITIKPINLNPPLTFTPVSVVSINQIESIENEKLK